MNYTPDKWLVVKISPKDKPTYYRVLGTWSGGYTHGDTWRLNSGVVGVREDDTFYYFAGHSGSEYACRKGMYGSTGYGYTVLNSLIESGKLNDILVEQIPEETNWKELVL